MNKLKIATLGFLMTIGMIACKKNDATTTSNLDASKTSSIAKGEPVSFTLSQVPAGTTVNWSVSPSSNVQINSSGNKASILFGLKGNYTVRGVYGSTSATANVSVSDSVYIPGGSGGPSAPSTLPFSNGETINITASRIDSGSTSGLILSALTTNSYTCLENSLLSTYRSNGNSLSIAYTGVSVPAGCTTGTAKATAFSYFYPLASGTNTLSIIFNGTTYSGTIVKTGNNYSIHWSYTSGVIISPTSL